jgi:hypothetical protein
VLGLYAQPRGGKLLVLLVVLAVVGSAQPTYNPPTEDAIETKIEVRPGPKEAMKTNMCKEAVSILAPGAPECCTNMVHDSRESRLIPAHSRLIQRMNPGRSCE